MVEKDCISREAAFDALFGQFCASSDETEAALNAAIEEIRAIPAADVVSGSDFRDCRNELCLRCGNYKQAHNGACDGCRWRKN